MLEIVVKNDASLAQDEPHFPQPQLANEMEEEASVQLPIMLKMNKRFR